MRDSLQPGAWPPFLVELADEVLGSAEFDEVLRGSMRVDEHREILVEALRAYEARWRVRA